jgi:uncharacterized Zn-finger protein
MVMRMNGKVMIMPDAACVGVIKNDPDVQISVNESRDKTNADENELSLFLNLPKFEITLGSKEQVQQEQFMTTFREKTNESEDKKEKEKEKTTADAKVKSNMYVDSDNLKDANNETNQKYVCTLRQPKHNSGFGIARKYTPMSDGRYHCPLCIKHYADRKTLRRHLRLHDPKCDRCPICQKRFAQKTFLQSHIRIHTGEKPFQCDTCCKFFRYKRNLRQHKLKHSDLKPYPCSYCSNAYHSKQSLRYHVKTKHNPPQQK